MADNNGSLIANLFLIVIVFALLLFTSYQDSSLVEIEKQLHDIKFNYSVDANPLCENWGGSYDPVTGIIYVCTLQNSLQGNHMISEHELGHYYWHNHVSIKDKSKYCEQWNKSVLHVSNHSEISCEEDFAELYGNSLVYEYQPTQYKRFDSIMGLK